LPSDTGPTLDIHTHPAEPRSVRLGLIYHF